MSLIAFMVTLGKDLIPDAVNWANIIGNNSNATQTIQGIDDTITIGVSSSMSTTPLSGNMTVLKNAVSQGNIDMSASSDSLTFTAADGDDVNFSVVSAGTWGGTITVTNQSKGGYTLDTFTISDT